MTADRQMVECNYCHEPLPYRDAYTTSRPWHFYHKRCALTKIREDQAGAREGGSTR